MPTLHGLDLSAVPEPTAFLYEESEWDMDATTVLQSQQIFNTASLSHDIPLCVTSTVVPPRCLPLRVPRDPRVRPVQFRALASESTSNSSALRILISNQHEYTFQVSENEHEGMSVFQKMSQMLDTYYPSNLEHPFLVSLLKWTLLSTSEVVQLVLAPFPLKALKRIEEREFTKSKVRQLVSSPLNTMRNSINEFPLLNLDSMRSFDTDIASAADHSSSISDVTRLISLLKAKADNCESQMINIPMDTFSSKRVTIRALPQPAPFFTHLPTQKKGIRDILSNTETAGSLSILDTDVAVAAVQWNPYPMLMHILMMENSEPETTCMPWEETVREEFPELDFLNEHVVGDDAVDLCFDEIPMEAEPLPLFAPARNYKRRSRSASMRNESSREGISKRTPIPDPEPIMKHDPYEFIEHNYNDFDSVNLNAVNQASIHHNTILEESVPIDQSTNREIDDFQDDFDDFGFDDDAILNAIQFDDAFSPAPADFQQQQQQPNHFVVQSPVSNTSKSREMDLNNRNEVPKTPVFSAKRAVESFMALRQVQRKTPKTSFLHTSASNPIVQAPIRETQDNMQNEPFQSPYALENLTFNTDASQHTYIIGSRLIRNIRFVELLEALRVSVIERDNFALVDTANVIPEDFDVIIDERTCVVLCPAILLFQKIAVGPNAPPGLYATLLKLARKFQHVTLIADLECNRGRVTQHMSESILCAVNAWGAVLRGFLDVGVEIRIAWAQNLEEAARLVREIGDIAASSVEAAVSARHLKSVYVPKPWASKQAWEARTWLSAEESAMKLSEFLALSERDMAVYFGLWIPAQSLHQFHRLIHSRMD
ncbi:hypothetical protein CcCBS67573_g04202 [Chytriomyces confervae]|uniref:Uncharacterized protein n=1 Tax=Chytriomyces confervae TaxID=246404 RepID=A0A507FG14_9FUNG|nr:hypothetical protein CcCBS67573_g04202 [Chytriomyces confervae]